MSADAAVNVVQDDGNAYAPQAAGAHAASGVYRQLIRGLYGNIMGFQDAVGY